MTQQIQAMMWASFIIAVALLLKEQSMSSSAAFGVVAGLTGAAIGSMGSRCTKKGCGA